MGESRDANDPRDLLRGLRKEAEAEFEEAEAHDGGGQEHASRADREGVVAERRAVEGATRDVTRSTQAQGERDRQVVPRGDAATGGGGNATRGEPAEAGAERRDEGGENQGR